MPVAVQKGPHKREHGWHKLRAEGKNVVYFMRGWFAGILAAMSALSPSSESVVSGEEKRVTREMYRCVSLSEGVTENL